MPFLRTEREGDLLIWWLDQDGERHNKLTMNALDDLDQSVNEVESDESIQAIVVISAKSDCFIVGADVDMLKSFRTRADAEALSRKGHDLLRRVQSLGKPIVAAMHGPAMGGGLELALACSMRIASDHPATIFALPEVRLGLLPGGGGTQLLPRLIGIQSALPLLLTGKNLYAHPARRMGLVDALIHQPGLLQAAKRAARDLVSGKRPAHQKRRRPLLESNPLTRRIIYSAAEKKVEKETRGNYPAPPRIIDCVRTGIEDGIEAGFLAEERHFADLCVTVESRELVRLFFARNEAEKNRFTGAREVRRLGILGAGLMGSGIAQVSAERGFDVVIKDESLELAGKARAQIYRETTAQVRKRALRRFDRDGVVERVVATEDYEPFRHVDLIIEAAPEDLELKRKLIRDTEQHAAPETIFASNTSSIPIHLLAEASARPRHVIGMHYFSPVPKMPLLEIIRKDDTPEWVLATAVEVGLRQGKTVIVVHDGPGFYTTRILAVFMNEALQLLEGGAEIRSVDNAMRDFGFPLGPFELFDLVGIDVASKITEVLFEFFGNRGMQSSTKARSMVDSGLKGRKTGVGFYQYEGKRPSKKEVNKVVYRSFGGSERPGIDPAAVQERLSLSMVNEAIHCLHDGILASARDGDVGAVFGLGFPPFLGGPFRFVDSRGSASILQCLNRLRERYGEQFAPSPLLEDYARDGRSFY